MAVFADLVTFLAFFWDFLMARRALERTLVATRTSWSFSSPSELAVRLAPATTLPAAEPRVSLTVTSTSSSADAIIKSPFEPVQGLRAHESYAAKAAKNIGKNPYRPWRAGRGFWFGYCTARDEIRLFQV